MHRHSAFTLSRAMTASAVALVLFSGCGGGASSVLPNGGAPTSSASGRVVQKLSLLIPAKGYANSRRAPQYTSISTKGIGISLVLQGASVPTNPATLTTPDVAIDLATTPISVVGDLGPNGQSISCTAVTTPQPGQDCTLALSLPTDVADIVVNAWDAAPTTGRTSFPSTAQLLSTAVAAIAVTSGASGPTITLVLDGIPAALQIVPSPQQTHFVPAGTSSTGASLYTEIGSGPVNVTFDALDADGNIIIGNGAPTVQWQIAQNGASAIAGSVASGVPTNVSIAPFLTNAAAFASSYALTATAATPSGTPLSTSIAIQPAQELWLPTVMGAFTTGRGPQSAGGLGAAIIGYEIPPNSGTQSMSATPLSADTVTGSSFAQCPGIPTGATAAPFDSLTNLAADPFGNLWALLVTPYSTATSTGQASCVEGFAVQNTANPPQSLPNSTRLLSSTDNFSGCTIDRFDTLWCIDATTDTLDGYNLQASGTAPFSVANVTLPISLPPAGTATTPIAIAVQPGGTNLWLAMAASVVGTSTTTTFYAREIPITTASSSAPSLGSPSNWAQFGTSYDSANFTAPYAIPVPDPPLAVDASDNIYSVDVGNASAGTEAPLIGMWTPSLGGGSLSFGNSPTASVTYAFSCSIYGCSSNNDEPFDIGPDGALWAGDFYQGITRYTLSGSTLASDALLSPVGLPSGSIDGFVISP